MCKIAYFAGPGHNLNNEKDETNKKMKSSSRKTKKGSNKKSKRKGGNTIQAQFIPSWCDLLWGYP